MAGDPNTNTSATGGPMLPNTEPAPLEGIPLLDAFQETFVALTGLDTTMVRPGYQSNPPNAPGIDRAWMAFNITARSSDTFPVIQHAPSLNWDMTGLEWDDDQIQWDGGVDEFQRQQFLKVLCSFYDDGSTGRAYELAGLLKDNLSIPQNMEALQTVGIWLQHVGDEVALPTMLKELWLFRVDVELRFTRQINRNYRILNIAKGHGTILAPSVKLITDPFVTPDPPES